MRKCHEDLKFRDRDVDISSFTNLFFCLLDIYFLYIFVASFRTKTKPMSSSIPDFVYKLVLFASIFTLATCNGAAYSNTWVIQLDGGKKAAERIAFEKDLTLLGQVRGKISTLWSRHSRDKNPTRRLSIILLYGSVPLLVPLRNSACFRNSIISLAC